VIGLSRTLSARYLDGIDLLGNNFHVVMPYLLMIVVLLVRPFGLFGTKQVRRV
jgi:branched-chain amino acid transport system permease protein